MSTIIILTIAVLTVVAILRHIDRRYADEWIEENIRDIRKLRVSSDRFIQAEVAPNDVIASFTPYGEQNAQTWRLPASYKDLTNGVRYAVLKRLGGYRQVGNISYGFAIY